MSVDARREQLLDVGIALSVTRQVDEISIDDITDSAGVSRALFYRYFKNKREFFLESVRRACDMMMIATEPDPSVPPEDRLRVSIDRYFDYAVANAEQYRAIHQGAWSGDVEVRQIILDSMTRYEGRIIETIPGVDASSALLRSAARGWLAFLIVNFLSWLETGEPERDELRDLCISVLSAAILAVFQQAQSQDILAPRAA